MFSIANCRLPIGKLLKNDPRNYTKAREIHPQITQITPRCILREYEGQEALKYTSYFRPNSFLIG